MVTKNTPTLSTLPLELLFDILDDVSYNDVQAFRRTSHHFFSILPPPMDTHLEKARSSLYAADGKLLACAGCLRLLPQWKFARRMISEAAAREYNYLDEAEVFRYIAVKKTAVNTTDLPRRDRFCIECGRRDLPGPYRYQLGDQWEDHYLHWYVRCEKCKKINRAALDIKLRMCKFCG